MNVAVLISTYNGEKYICQQLDSLLNQKCDSDISIWIRDDGSTDNTLAIVSRYTQKHSNIHILEGGNNLRSAFSFLELVRECGIFDFYAFCDQDDYWYEDKIQTAITQLINISQPAIYYCNARIVDTDLNPTGRNVYKNPPHTDFYTMICAANIIGCTMVFNYALVKKIREVDKPACMTMHDSYLARICLSLGGIVYYDHLPHMEYRQHDHNVMGIKSGLKETIQQRVNDIFHKAPVSIAEQSYEILKLYGSEISEEKKKWLLQVVNYRKNIFTRVALALSRKPKNISFNMEVKLRGSILLGNR